MNTYITEAKSKLQRLQERLISQAELNLSASDSGKMHRQAKQERSRIAEGYLAILSGALEEIKEGGAENQNKEEFFQITDIMNLCRKSLDMIEALNKLPESKRMLKNSNAKKIRNMNQEKYNKVFNAAQEYNKEKFMRAWLKKEKKSGRKHLSNPRNRKILIKVNPVEFKLARKFAREDAGNNVSALLRRLLFKKLEGETRESLNAGILEKHEKIIDSFERLLLNTKKRILRPGKRRKTHL
jgi:hypothetical protein